MTRRRKLLVAVLALVPGVPLVVLLLAVILGNTQLGRHAIEAWTARLSDGRISIEGLSGRFPDAPRLRGLVLRDASGPWLSAQDLALDWSPLALIGGRVDIGMLGAGEIHVARRPIPAASASHAGGGPSLPITVDLAALRLDRIDLDAAVAGRSARLRASGHLRVRSLEDAAAHLLIERMDEPGRYAIDATAGTRTVAAHIAVDEAGQGLLGSLAGLPGIGALRVSGSLAGPSDAAVARIDAAAGPARATIAGTLDLAARSGTMAVDADAPAMQPMDELGWRRIAVTARLSGAFDAPGGTASIDIEEPRYSGAAASKVTVTVNADRGRGSANATAVIAGLTLPGKAGPLFAATPMRIDANAAFGAAPMAVNFALHHDRLTMTGTAAIGDAQHVQAKVSLPELAPFAALANTALRGDAVVELAVDRRGDAMTGSARGQLTVAGGVGPWPALVGRDAGIDLAWSSDEAGFAVDRLRLDSARLHLAAAGADRDRSLSGDWTAHLDDVSALSSSVQGAVELHGGVQGAIDDFRIDAGVTGSIGAAGGNRQPVTLDLAAQGLPNRPSGRLTVASTLEDAPLHLSARLDSVGAGWHFLVDRGEWKSVQLAADLSASSARAVPSGRAALNIGRLDDLAEIAGLPLAGSIEASLTSPPRSGTVSALRLSVAGHGISMADAHVAELALDGTVADPLGRPETAMHLTARGVGWRGMSGDAELRVSGPAAALSTSAVLHAAGLPSGAASAELGAVADLDRRRVRLDRLVVATAAETARLVAPCSVDLSNGLALDRLDLAMAEARLRIEGRLAPQLAMNASLRNFSPALARPFWSGLPPVTGQFAAAVHLAGDPQSPRGTVTLTGRGVGGALASGGMTRPVSLDGRADLDGATARLGVHLGDRHGLAFDLTGFLPLKAAGRVDLRANGTVDLGVAAPILAASGQAMDGRVTLDAALAGSLDAPVLSGRARLENASFQDFTRGIDVAGLGGDITFDHDRLIIARLDGKAGNGTVSVSGDIGLLQPQIPVALSLRMRGATPLASDLLTATADGQVTISGSVAGQIKVAGRVMVDHADINIPESLAPDVAVLEMRKPEGSTVPPAAPQSSMALALTIDAPERVFVRGRGLDAELGGRLRLAGSAADPQIGGGFDLRRGTFALAGTTLTFTSGKVTFTGEGLDHRLDPAIDFIATATTGGVTATLEISGYADAPKISLTSVPQLPPDEVLARLLFGQSVKQLSALQIAEIAQGLVTLSGAGGSGGFANPVAAIRQGLGLDRLSVGQGGNGQGTSVEAGRYVASGVYVGARQSTGAGPQAKVQIDLTRRLKLETAIGTGSAPVTGVTPQNDPGSSIGLSYQLDY